MKLRSMAALLQALGIAGCAGSPAKPTEAEKVTAVAKRIDEICELPDAERQAAIDKLKAESGLVVICGKSPAEQP